VGTSSTRRVGHHETGVFASADLLTSTFLFLCPFFEGVREQEKKRKCACARVRAVDVCVECAGPVCDLSLPEGAPEACFSPSSSPLFYFLTARACDPITNQTHPHNTTMTSAGLPYGLQAMLKDGHRHFAGVDEAVLKNIEAVKAIAACCASSMGPHGEGIERWGRVLLAVETVLLLLGLGWLGMCGGGRDGVRCGREKNRSEERVVEESALAYPPSSRARQGGSARLQPPSYLIMARSTHWCCLLVWDKVVQPAPSRLADPGKRSTCAPFFFRSPLPEI
jgi:hypothetical protein